MWPYLRRVSTRIVCSVASRSFSTSSLANCSRTWDCFALLALSLVLRMKRSSVAMMSLSWVEMRVASASFWRASLKLMAMGADYAE